jgi:hypothetical protein
MGIRDASYSLIYGYGRGSVCLGLQLADCAISTVSIEIALLLRITLSRYVDESFRTNRKGVRSVGMNVLRYQLMHTSRNVSATMGSKFATIISVQSELWFVPCYTSKLAQASGRCLL